ncbi:hypothetical protein ACFVTP_22445 [Streptomyces celluloflavus]|uniref:hypothetical protein n=1 Tax=Streptomyces celluloflavus TaxID=58344 RepID=UPI0036DD495F
MSKYIADTSARSALEAAARYADRGGPVPFVWSGAQWTTPGGEWRDWPLIRRGMGEWLRGLVAGLDAEGGSAERRKSLRDAMHDHRFAALHTTDADDKAWHTERADALTRDLDALPAPANVAPSLIRELRTVASEIESASDTRASQLLSLASQFDAFRAPLNDPATWVRNLGAAPYGTHVRTSAVWEAFAAAEPVLARSLGTVTGKRAVFAAMDKRFGARRKLSGYEGWRGVSLDG